jgi:hypothetical protein
MPRQLWQQIDDVRLESRSADSMTTQRAEQLDAATSSIGGSSVWGANALVRTTTSPAATPANRGSEAGWQIDSTVYMWLQGLHGRVDTLGRNIGFKASPVDLASRADFGLQGVLATQHNRLTLIGDVLWTPITIKQSNSLLDPAPAVLSQAKYTPVIVTPEFGYRVIDSRRISIDALTGFRYWHLGADLTLAPVAGGSSLNKPSNWVDPLVGARIRVPLSPRLNATILGDAGGWGVGSQLDYQMAAALCYTITPPSDTIKPRWAIDTAWRYLYSDYSQSQIHTRIAQSGIVLGVTYRIKGPRSTY